MKTILPLLAAMLTLCSITGCVTRVQIIPADKTVLRLPKNENFIPATPGYFVPDARMKEILDRLAEKEVLEP